MLLPGQTLAPAGDPYYNDLIVQKLHNPALVQPRPPTDSRQIYTRGKITPSVYYQRARLGHQYWYQEPTKRAYGQITRKWLNLLFSILNVLCLKLVGSKVTMGARSTVLGLGFAPRK